MYRGTEKLLYIGKTKRSFSKRLNDHYIDWIYGTRDIHVRLEILEFPSGGKYSEQKLSDVEALLISWHTPIENTQCTNYYIGRENLEVISFGQTVTIFNRIKYPHHFGEDYSFSFVYSTLFNWRRESCSFKM